jgi:hypothetical protein
MAAPPTETTIPVLHKKRSKSAISVVIPHDPFTDNRDAIGPEDVRRITEEKIYWTNEARAWKERAHELMAALREIAEYVKLVSRPWAMQSSAAMIGMKCSCCSSNPIFLLECAASNISHRTWRPFYRQPRSER